MNDIKIGIIGCGTISSIYMQNIPTFNYLSLIACADLDINKARTQAKKHQIPKVYSVDELLNDPAIDPVINLSIPKDHANVCIQIHEADKHVYVKKPLAVTRSEADSTLDVAETKGLLIGSAPDTFLGGGIQTALHLIEIGEIGKPIGASAFMIWRGHEHLHSDPSFYYDLCGSPIFNFVLY